jgi:nuclear pore complex protein Nup62
VAAALNSNEESSKQTFSGFGGFGGLGNTATRSIPQSNSVSFGSNDDSKPAAAAKAVTTTAFAGFGSHPATFTALAAPIYGELTTQNESNSGAGAAAAPPTPQHPSTPGPPAPVATPAKDTPAPAVPAPTAATPAAAASSSATANPPPPAMSTEPVRLEYQTMTVEQILNMFQQEMEKDTKVYLEEARRVAEYDAILRDSQFDLNVLTEQTRQCLIDRKVVEQTLNGIGAMQAEVGRVLVTVELNVDELFSSAQSSLMPTDADFERERAYKMAHDVFASIAFRTGGKAQPNGRHSRAAMSGLGDVAKIVQVRNQHQNSLTALEDAGRHMEHDIGQVNRVLLQYKP